jgi:hypothetical protein
MDRIAFANSRTDTFLGARYRRLAGAAASSRRSSPPVIRY